MANLIDTVVVNGTEYETVGLGGKYPVAVFKNEVYEYDFDGFASNSDNTISVSDGDVTPTFKFVQINRNGSISYELAIITDDPATYLYSEASEC